MTLNPLKEIVPYPSQRSENFSLPVERIPTDAAKFYRDFGLLIHPKTALPVRNLTDYQLAIWNDKSKYRLVIKSQKVGLSTSALLEDFQKALTTCKGKDILVISQTQYHANEHLLTLKTHIINSEKYRKYLITESEDFLFREQKTKAKEIQIKNPDNALRPSRIIALGASEGAVWSWKNVAHIHMSDIAANNLKDDSPLFAAAFSRLANTGGSMLIESPPRGPRGKTFDIYQKSMMGQIKEHEGRFKIFHVTAQDGVKAGLITQQFLTEEKARLGALYPQYYEAEFIAVSGNLFNQASIDKCIVDYDLTNYKRNSEKYIAVDEGYKTSKFAIIVLEYLPRVKKVRVLLAEEIEHPTSEQMANRIFVYRQRFGNVLNVAVDATAHWDFTLTLKSKTEDSTYTPFIEEQIAKAKREGLDINKMMRIIPIFFNTQTKSRMAERARRIIEDHRQILQIHPSFINLITAIRSAVFDDRGQLDKELTPHNDILDAFLMGCTFFHFCKK